VRGRGSLIDDHEHEVHYRFDELWRLLRDGAEMLLDQRQSQCWFARIHRREDRLLPQSKRETWVIRKEGWFDFVDLFDGLPRKGEFR